MPCIAATLPGLARSGTTMRAVHAEEPRGEGHRLAVVAGRGGDHPGGPLGGGQLRDQVDTAAHLERADRLVVLVLDIDLGADQLVQRRIAVQRRARQVGADLPLGQQDIVKLGAAVVTSVPDVSINSPLS